ncbi:MAG: class I SAM-dependent methyltransferase family protein, partial [Actinomycetota bacterium]
PGPVLDTCDMSDAPSSSWARWHADYDDPGSDLALRLSVVQQRVRRAIESTRPGPVQLISVCAGQGRDVIGSLNGHPRAGDVRALLVEVEGHNVDVARARAAAAGLAGVTVVRGDASATSVFRDAVPADVLLLCGIFGNISPDDVRTTVAAASSICAPGAIVVWTRHRRPPDQTPSIRSLFSEAGFEEVAFDSPGEDRFAVGAHRLIADPLPYDADLRMFTFLERP